MSVDRLLVVDEVAVWFRVKRATVYTWTSQHKIPFLKVNGALRFSEAELRRWLQAFAQAHGIPQ